MPYASKLKETGAASPVTPTSSTPMMGSWDTSDEYAEMLLVVLPPTLPPLSVRLAPPVLP